MSRSKLPAEHQEIGILVDSDGLGLKIDNSIKSDGRAAVRCFQTLADNDRLSA